jgi:hypothetical protein
MEATLVRKGIAGTEAVLVSGDENRHFCPPLGTL